MKGGKKNSEETSKGGEKLERDLEKRKRSRG